MIKFFRILIVLILSSIYCFGIIIKGRVITIDGKPLKGAYVFYKSRKAITDNNGYFSLEIDRKRKIRLTVTHEEYMGKEIVLTYKDYSREIIIMLVPYIRQSEEIVVTAMRYPEPLTHVPAAETVITRESINEKMPTNIADTIFDNPGVSNIGIGGFNKVPSIRGLARRRVLILIDNSRIWSDRRTGPDASFLNPYDIEKIEVLRSPSSVFYGSDAIGGVIHILTKENFLRDFEGRIYLNFNTNNKEKKAGISFGKRMKNFNFYFSLQGRDGENYHAPSGEILMSHFSSFNLTFKTIYKSENRNISLSYIGEIGRDIGKPKINSSTKPTWYPEERQNLIIFHWNEKKFILGGDFSFRAYFNPNSLETRKEKISSFKEKESYALNKSKNYGFQFTYSKKIMEDLRLTGGIDIFGRAKVEAKNEDTYFNSLGEIIRKRLIYPIRNGWRNDVGLFISADYSWSSNLDLAGGLRIDFLKTKVSKTSSLTKFETSKSTWTGFIGASWSLPYGFTFFGNLSRAYRFPSLNELFYTGITGRGYIIGNPDLRPEVSLNIDTGMKFIGKRIFGGLYLFKYTINNMIEYYEKEKGIYTYNNIEKGEIKGIELELEYYPVTGWKIFGNFHSYKGKSLKTGNWLNDIPPTRLILGTKLWKGKFWGEIYGIFQKEKNNPGPAEIRIPEFSVFNFKTGIYFSPSMQFYFNIANIFNREYKARPDPYSPFEPGRSFILGINYGF
ncbi:TonB-dependent receptor [SCandidatus Aminicenantes bacterium Aminicenantia_JdfR_composite]|nr:TonB-dependent receptor [SCandidatus Aminicenantes bacterium Aminicenantia_JdfR_composite]MCP2596583.1 TonB-dependent receptor [Candidatus Aminicenantes bacterium AC-335-G13]MCP2598182.1 TonB-dependent receptor [Candidatus Aminicenantes bacterium AC-335-L06]MCP2620989.1 TonB-dependent receptor [Candidatus Aminicenantes bacterium AC-334-E05]